MDDYGSKTQLKEMIDFAHEMGYQKTDFNIVLGLCVGHDTLCFKYSKIPVSVLAVKDRVLAHNPLGAVYLADSYFKDKF